MYSKEDLSSQFLEFWPESYRRPRDKQSHALTYYVCPLKNGEIELWSNTRVVKCKYDVSQKQNGFDHEIQWYSIFLTFMFKFSTRLKD